MKHDEKIRRMRESLTALIVKLAAAENGETPKDLDMQKLEKTYDHIMKEYVMVLKKRNS